MLWKNNLKAKLSEIFNCKRCFGEYFQWKECTYFQKICSWTSIAMPNWSKTFQAIWWNSSILVLEKQPKNIHYSDIFLPLREPLVATFNETRAPTSRKHVANQGIVIPNWSKTFQRFWFHSSVSTLGKQPEKLNFQRFFNSKGIFGSYFQWNACTYFPKICSWTSYNNVKLIKNISNSFVTLLRFSLRKITRKDKFLECFCL